MHLAIQIYSNLTFLLLMNRKLFFDLITFVTEEKNITVVNTILIDLLSLNQRLFILLDYHIYYLFKLRLLLSHLPIHMADFYKIHR